MLDPEQLSQILQQVQSGECSAEDAHKQITAPPSHPLELRIDHDRQQRCGQPEVIYGEGKSPEQLLQALKSVWQHHNKALATRVSPADADFVQRQMPELEYNASARCLFGDQTNSEGCGRVAIVCAGTSDCGVAEEARITANWSGCNTHAYYDVGVAGIHRLLDIQDELHKAHCIVVVAGMEGALASVVAGLVAIPVIAVPTSVGYGASFGGVAALLAMLNSCANGVAVMNIDNGFGAGLMASKINRLGSSSRRPSED